METGALLMGRPKTGKKAGKRPPQDERVAIIHLKGTPAYAEWLDKINRLSHIPKAAIVRLAVADWAAKQGYPGPPEF